jgi:energy-coupling factor transporter ATP-binding protein EcfA2
VQWKSPKAREAYQQIVQRVREHLENGSDLFGFVGQAASGKTHALKALDRLLRDHGVGSPEAQFHLDEAHAPRASEGRIFDYVYTGEQANWVIMDAGGELYAAIQDNDWSTLEADQAQLTHFLHHCKGLFFFLHLTPAHFDPRLMSQDPSLEDDAIEQARASARQARRAQRELMFFRNFLLFLRALKAENGNVTKVVDKCRWQQSLEKGLRGYEQSSPRLDLPVMVFFTKADSYGPGFEIADGIQFDPRNIPMGPMVFTARYLPLLFQGLLQHVRRFKFDFLQSYVEYPMVQGAQPVLDEAGKPLTRIHWVADPTTPLSVGLLSGLEFVLRHQSPGKRTWNWWNGPGIDTRSALLLHRQFHPKLWQGVKADLGSYRQALKEML